MSLLSFPVCKPRLPKADSIFPYLKQIDENRWYTNFGPLYSQFLARIAELFNIPVPQVVSGTNGTILIELCLKALNVEKDTYCILPSWTFTASTLAVAAANLKPYFVDVDRETQSINPEKLLNDLPLLQKNKKIGAILVTAPFGIPVNVSAWDEFTEVTGIPVIIDAAAAFDSMLQVSSMKIGRTPMMVSLHATKVFGIGEGGLLFSTNEDMLIQVANLMQFGFPRNVRNSHFLGTNAKLSEYAAAVGLASLDEWPQTRKTWLTLSQWYHDELQKVGIAHMQSSKWTTSTCNIIIQHQANALLSTLEEQGINARKWWGDGCHNQIAFQQYPRTDLKNTEFLYQSVLGLPLYLGMTERDVKQIVASLNKATCNNREIKENADFC